MPTKNENREAAAAVGVVVVVSAAFTHFFCVSSVLDQTRAPSLAEGGTKRRRKKVWASKHWLSTFCLLGFFASLHFFSSPWALLPVTDNLHFFNIKSCGVTPPSFFFRCLLRFLKLTYFLQFKFPVCFFFFMFQKRNLGCLKKNVLQNNNTKFFVCWVTERVRIQRRKTLLSFVSLKLQHFVGIFF